MLIPGALAWTAGIAGYLVWTFLRRADEDRLLAEPDAEDGVPPDSITAD